MLAAIYSARALFRPLVVYELYFRQRPFHIPNTPPPSHPSRRCRSADRHVNCYEQPLVRTNRQTDVIGYWVGRGGRAAQTWSGVVVVAASGKGRGKRAASGKDESGNEIDVFPGGDSDCLRRRRVPGRVDQKFISAFDRTSRAAKRRAASQSIGVCRGWAAIASSRHACLTARTSLSRHADDCSASTAVAFVVSVYHALLPDGPSQPAQLSSGHGRHRATSAGQPLITRRRSPRRVPQRATLNVFLQMFARCQPEAQSNRNRRKSGRVVLAGFFWGRAT